LIVHANAALSRRQRRRLVSLVLAGMTVTAAATVVGCSRQTGSKWVGRDRRGEGLADRSSRPHRSPRRTTATVEQTVLQARRELRAGPHPLGWQLGLAASTVHAILKRHGCSRLNPTVREPAVRYERERPGELLHIDIKKLGRIQRPRNPATGRPTGAKGQAGWDYLFVCVDDHTRLAHCRLYPAETTANALDFLNHCQAFYNSYGIQAEEVLTDNGKCFQRQWETGCRQAAITPRHTRIRRPQTNGKAERLIRTLLNEWVRPYVYTDNNHRAEALPRYLDHYNHHRRHRALDGQTPTQRASTTSLGLTTRFATLTFAAHDESREPGSANPAEPGSKKPISPPRP
jgi:transposase InsO family protein